MNKLTTQLLKFVSLSKNPLLKQKFVMIGKYHSLLILVLLISGCKGRELSNFDFPTPEESGNKVSYQDANQLASDRASIFSNDLSLVIQSNESFFKQTIDLQIEIKNISSQSMVLKIPRSTGIASTYIFKSAANDVEIFLADANGELIDNVLPTSQFEFDPRMRDIIEAYAWHQQKDFVSLKPGQIYKYTFSIDEIYTSPENSSTYQILPNGEYLIYAAYRNHYIGYYAIENKNIERFDFVYKKDSLIYDLNAWVGEVTSNNVNIFIK